jgi:hypothetical protein
MLDNGMPAMAAESSLGTARTKNGDERHRLVASIPTAPVVDLAEWRSNLVAEPDLS